jgi:hypothetical protein
MPETPDFETMAERIAPPPSTVEPSLRRTLVGMIVEHLAIVWNARGEADWAAIEALELTTPLSMRAIENALRAVDR